MAKQYQRVEPTPFDAVGTGNSQATETDAARPTWLLPALGLLAVLALIVVFLLPGWVSDRAPATGQPPSGGATQPTAQAPKQASEDSRSATDEPGASPFADARAAKARAEAQELLGELLDVQENLTERGAQEWAADAMSAIAAEALAGDERYRERDFDAAIGNYEKALSDALALEASLPERFQAQLAATTAAIEALDMISAQRAIAVAGQLEPGAPKITELQARIDTLPRVAESVSAGQRAEADGDLEDAVAAFADAADMDGEHNYVSAELERLRSALNEERFNAAMSEGYSALDQGDFDRAQQRFERAGKLKSGSGEAAAALQELSVARTAATLNRMQERSETQIADEEWGAAIKTFEEALAIDKSLRFAREGLAYARPRAAAVKALQAIIDKPGRLVDDAILAEARTSLAQAAALDSPGPEMLAQIANAREVVAVASKPLSVTLQSDGLTEVTVYKVARLGTFEQQQLSLRPGSYTAVGTRRGFRDVRVEFTVAPGKSEPVYIACSEKIL